MLVISLGLLFSNSIEMALTKLLWVGWMEKEAVSEQRPGFLCR